MQDKEIEFNRFDLNDMEQSKNKSQNSSVLNYMDDNKQSQQEQMSNNNSEQIIYDRQESVQKYNLGDILNTNDSKSNDGNYTRQIIEDDLVMPHDSDINGCIQKLIVHRFNNKNDEFVNELDVLFKEEDKGKIVNNIVILSLTDELGHSKWKTNYINSFQRFVQNDLDNPKEIIKTAISNQWIIQVNQFLVGNKMMQIGVKFYQHLTDEQCRIIIQNDPEVLRASNLYFVERLYKTIHHNKVKVGQKYINEIYYNFLCSEYQKSYRTFKEYLITKNYQFLLIQLCFFSNVRINIESDDLIALLENNMFIFLKMYLKDNESNYKQFYDSKVNRALNDPHFYKKQDLIMNLTLSEYLTNMDISIFQRDSQIDSLVEKGGTLLQQPEIIEQKYQNPISFYCYYALWLNQTMNQATDQYSKLQQLRDEYIRIANERLMKVTNDQIMKNILFLPNSDGSTLINLLVENRELFIDIFRSNDFRAVVGQNWLGNVKAGYELLEQTFQYTTINDSHTKVYSEINQKQKQQNRAANGLTVNQDNDEFAELIEKDTNQNRNHKLIDYNIFRILEKMEYGKEQDQNSLVMFEVFQINQGIRKGVDQIFNLIVTSLVIWVLFVTAQDLKTPYSNWNSTYTDFFKLQVPSRYASNVTINQTEVQNFQTYQQKANFGEYEQYCGKLFNSVFVFKSKSFKITLMNYCKLFTEFKTKCNDDFWLRNTFLVIYFFAQTKYIANLVYQKIVNGRAIVKRDILSIVILNSIAVTVLFYANYSVAYTFEINQFLQYYKTILEYSQAMIIFASLYLNLSELQIFPTIGIVIESIKQINLSITSFVLFYFSKIIVLSGIFYILFKGLDSSYSTFIFTVISVSSNPLGSYNQISTSTTNTATKNNLITLHNWVSLGFQFYMMIIIINILIAILSNIYTVIVSESKKQLTCSIYLDYYSNIPDQMYSSINLLPSYLSFLQLLVIPLVLVCHSKKVNRTINIFNYCSGYLLIIIPIVLSLFLLMVLFNYFYFLFKIINFKYVSQTKIRINSYRNQYIVHFVSFLFLGLFYLFYKMVQDLLIIVDNIFKPVQQQQRMLFDDDLWIAFKTTIFKFRASDHKQVSLKTFIRQLDYQYLKCERYDKIKKTKLKLTMKQYLKHKEMEAVDIDDMHNKVRLTKMDYMTRQMDNKQKRFMSLEMQLNIL